MAKKICKCPACKKEFDRNSIQAVKVGARRYGHATCYPDNTDFVPMEVPASQDPDLLKLKEYIGTLFKTPNWAMINKQIKKYKDENGYSYSGIQKSLVYFYEVKNNPIDKANNAIGIVPFVYDSAYQYYLSIFMAQQASQNVSFVTKIKEIIIKPPQKRGTKQKLFDLEEWTDEE